MFLSGGGVYAHADPRRTSIAGAVQFAAGAELQGITLHTLALQEELHMVEAARNRGLRVRPAPPAPACLLLLLLVCRVAVLTTPVSASACLSACLTYVSLPLPLSLPLQMMTYGPCNNDPKFVLRQRALGVHGVIVDDVAGVAAAVLAAPLN